MLCLLIMMILSSYLFFPLANIFKYVILHFTQKNREQNETNLEKLPSLSRPNVDCKLFC